MTKTTQHSGTFQALAALALLLLGTSEARAQSYTITDLSGSIPNTAETFDMNNSGQITFHVPSFKTPGKGFVWSNGAATDLGAGGVLGINDAGQVAGWSQPGPFPYQEYHGYVWQNGTTTLLGGDIAVARDINNLGQVVGNRGNPNPVNGFLLDNGTFTDIPPLPSYQLVYAHSINDAGQVVGQSGNGFDPYHAFTYQNGVTSDLNSFLPVGSDWLLQAATGINNTGQIVGTAYINGDAHQFLLSQGIVYDLGGGSMSDLNNLGQVVTGSSLWANGSATDLNTLVAGSGWAIQSANAINDAGQIVGLGTFAGQNRVFLLTPVPEPGSWTMLAIGLLSVGWIRLSRDTKRSDSR